MHSLLCILISVWCATVSSAAPPIIPASPQGLLSPYGEKLVEYGAYNGTVLQGFLVYPKSVLLPLRKAAAVIVFHAFTGRTEFENQKARDLAKLGYVAFAADVYGKGVATNDTNANFGIMGQLLAERTTTLQRRVREAWNYVKNLPYVKDQKIGCTGYCFGGLTCLDLARFNVGLQAAVSFHGTLTNYPGNNTSIGASIQAHHGDNDPHTTNQNALDFLVEMRQRQADWHFTSYANAQHAFTVPGAVNWGIPGAAYNENADKRSHRAMEGFHAEKLLS